MIGRKGLFAAFWRTLITDQDYEQHKTDNLTAIWELLSEDLSNQSLNVDDLNTVWKTWVNERTDGQGLDADSLRDWKNSITAEKTEIPEQYRTLLVYKETCDKSIKYRKLFYTREGDMGLGSYAIMPGDHVCLLPGGRTPYILRGKPGTNQFELVGECYCHTLMKDAKPEETETSRTFELV